MANKYELKMAHSPASKGKVLSHLQISKGEDGGHVVEHHYAEDGMQYHKPKRHVFGKEEGSEMLAHVGKHMGVQHESPSEEEEDMEGK